MNPIFSHAKRDVQTVRCCGVIYKRWRFQGRKNFRGSRPTHATVCKVCGCKIFWNPNFKPAWIACTRAKERHDAYYEQRVDWLRVGLTSLGKPFRRTPNYLTVEDRLAARRRRGMKAWLKRAAKMAALGLTSRGTKRIYRRKEPAAIEQQWQAERAAMPAAPVADWETITGSLSR